MSLGMKMISDEAQDLLNTDVTEEALEAAYRLMSKAEATTTALRAIAVFLAENGDDKGAALIQTIIPRMAQHEVETM